MWILVMVHNVTDYYMCTTITVFVIERDVAIYKYPNIYIATYIVASKNLKR